MSDFYSETAFFDAWMRGIELAGTQFFRFPVSGEIRGKDDVPPDFDMVECGMEYLSSGERAFLAAMYSFYNAAAAQRLYNAVLVPGEVAALLDEPRRRVIADLLVSYTGW